MCNKVYYIFQCRRMRILVICPICGKAGTVQLRHRNQVQIGHTPNIKCSLTNNKGFEKTARHLHDTVYRIQLSVFRDIVRGYKHHRVNVLI